MTIYIYIYAVVLSKKEQNAIWLGIKIISVFLLPDGLPLPRWKHSDCSTILHKAGGYKKWIYDFSRELAWSECKHHCPEFELDLLSSFSWASI